MKKRLIWLLSACILLQSPLASLQVQANVAAGASEGTVLEQSIRNRTEGIEERETGEGAENGAGAESGTEAGSEAKGQTGSKTEGEAGKETERETEAERETGSEAETETERETGSEAETETERETGSEAETETERETGSEAETETEHETGSEAETETERETGSETEAESETETEMETETETEMEMETETESETDVSGNDISGNSVSGNSVSENTLRSAGEQEIGVVEHRASVLEVGVGSALDLGEPTELAVSLEGKETHSVMLGDSTKRSAVFENLDNGTYTLKIRGEGFSYRQEYRLENGRYQIEVNTDPSKVLVEGKPASGVGALVMGDFDGDGSVSEAELHELTEAVYRGTYEKQYDLNRDGQLNLTDLQYLSYSYGTEQSLAEAVVEQWPGKTTVFVDEKTELAGGSPENLFEEGKEPLQLKAKGADGAVSLTLDMEEMGKAEELRIRTPEDNAIQSGSIGIEDTSGNRFEVKIPESGSRMARAGLQIEREADGTLRIHLGGQIAVKKVTILITETEKTDLAEISRVEFVNGMENRIPEPEMNIPGNLQAEAGNKTFRLSWDPETNIAGYEVEISSEGASQYYRTANHTLQVVKFQDKELVNGQVYRVRVQSVNGEWKSGFGESIEVRPVVTGTPPPPDNVTVEGDYRSLKISWKKMEDTDSYHLYYREKGASEYTHISGIKANGYLLEGLKDSTIYQVYVTGQNDLGEGKPSTVNEGKTSALSLAVSPDYKLINVPVEGQEAAYNIGTVEYPGGQKEGGVYAVTDHNPATYWYINDWDSGASYSRRSPIVTFEKPEEMDTIVIVPDGAQKFHYSKVRVMAWEENGQEKEIPGTLRRMASLDGNGKDYYEFISEEPFTAKKVQVNFSTSAGVYNRISIAELKFYYYDSLADEIDGLFTDETHVALQADVTEERIGQLQERLDTPDPVSKEYHPKKKVLQLELDLAAELLRDQGAMGEQISVHTDVTMKKDGHITFRGGLNAWQPLGVAAYEGQQLTVYVGSSAKKTGENADLKLILTQYYGRSDAWKQEVMQLKVGRNEVVIPGVSNFTETAEHGGSLYVEYTGNNPNEQYTIRLLGGDSIPALDMTLADGAEERKALAKAYIAELEKQVENLQDLHDTKHSEENLKTEIAFDRQRCILGATDIVLKNMMYSVSAEQILNGLGSGTMDEKAEKLCTSLDAMEHMVDLFYQHKGLSSDAGAGAKNQLPSSRLNIRYQQMFHGAFMYAGGAHIGIGWGSVAGLIGSQTVQADEKGKYQSGEYFGWGIAHEIGHIINEGAYAVAEVTNNYFAQLTMARDTNATTRFQYQNVYEKVTSGAVGRSDNEATQLALYWQLHLAYDTGYYNFKTFDNYSEQLQNLIYARMDTYARDTSKAPMPGGVALTLNGGVDNNLMRLACAAAQKNLLSFFQRWGMTPDNATLRYASQFPEETRGIYYVTDEARAYQIEHGENGSVADQVTVSAAADVVKNTNRVKLQLSNDAQDPRAMLGYEIARIATQKGKEIREVVAFVTADQTSYEDIVTTLNNRVFTYEVTGYDQYLNPTGSYRTEAVKVADDGSMDKSGWSLTTNMTSEKDQNQEAGENDPCAPVVTPDIHKAADQDAQTTYVGKAADAVPEVVVNLNGKETITGLKYTWKEGGSPITDYEILVSADGSSWSSVKKGTFRLENGEAKVFFNKEGDDRLYAYKAGYVKLRALSQKNTEIGITELDLLHQTGDNIELAEDGIGILKEDYVYEASSGAKIPKGSFIVTGTYKGNPAYNVVLLFNQDQKALSGSQIILANVPEHGELGETSEGIWIYWIEPEELEKRTQLPTQIRAELYRVDQADSNRGERMTSDTLARKVPERLPDITIGGGKQGKITAKK